MSKQKDSLEQLNKGLMTSGSIWKQLFNFAMPLLLGNLFQQLYNAVDSAIVGQYVGKEALAAVGSSASLINLIVNLFMGLAIGGSVCISQYYGANDNERLHNAMHTMSAFALLLGVGMSVFGALLSKPMLQLMGTPEDIMDLSDIYFKVFFAGSIGTVAYNIGSGLLRAVGDSKRPLYYLIISSFLNIGLDFLFVGGFNWGVSGAAAATDVAQFLSAFLVVGTLMRTKESYKIILKDIKIYKEELKRIVRLGLPTAVQGSIVSLSNVFVQSSINLFGSVVVAGCGAYMKLDGFVILPALSFSMAMTTFSGQNIGAGEYERVKDGLKKGLILGVGAIGVITVCLQFITEPLLSLFTHDQDVIDVGMRMMHMESIGYILIAVTHLISGALRGVGLTKIPMFIMVGCWCVIRVLWLAIVARPMHSLTAVLVGYPGTWLLSCVIIIIYIWKVDWIHYYDQHLKQN